MTEPTHGDPGAYNCTVPGCAIPGHKGPPGQPGELVFVFRFSTSANPIVEPPMGAARGPQGADDGPGRGPLTPAQERDLEFLAWLRERGRA